MPYHSTHELPDSVRNHLPPHGCEIYLAAFNHAWQEYANSDKRRDDASLEETAHRVAWSAVEKKYEKKNDRWVSKS